MNSDVSDAPDPYPPGYVPYVPEPVVELGPKLQKLGLSAPLRWLKLGWRDLRRAPQVSLFFGVCFALMGLAVLAVFQHAPIYTLALLSPAAVADPPAAVAARTVAQALELLAGKTTELDAFANRRADTLLADHRRVREAGEATGKYTVKALLPADVIGLYVLLPKVS